MFGSGILSYITQGSSSSSSTVAKSPQSPPTRSNDALIGGLQPVEVIRDRFYFACFPTKNTLQSFQENVDPATTVLFTIDRVLQYEPFCHDFGPLNIGKLYRFCQMVTTKLEDPELKESKIVVYSCNGSKKRSNLAYLIGAYQVLCLNRSADEAWQVVSKDQPEYLPFRDASMGHCTYRMTVEHCIHAAQTAIRLGFIDWKSFDIESYEHYERVENGDLTVIIPNKFVHFSGPTDTHKDSDGYPTMNPDHYVPIFKKLGVSDVVRLNQPLYDRNSFINHGIQHHDFYFVDGTTPSMALLERFINVCETAKGAIAVHCKAGLGRTGTVVGCYMMKHYKMTASEVIAWLRICRPGSVLGPQQQYLEKMQSTMWSAGSSLAKKADTISIGSKKKKKQGDLAVKDASSFWLQPWSSTSKSEEADDDDEVEEDPSTDGFTLMAVDNENEQQLGLEDMEIDSADSIGKDKVITNRFSTGGGASSALTDQISRPETQLMSPKGSQGDILMRQKTEAQKHRFLL